MASQKTLKLFVYVDGVNDVPFFGSDISEYEEYISANGENYVTADGYSFNVRNVNKQIEIGSFRYDAKRMGEAPSLTFTLMYQDCLDTFWSEDVYATFNGERHFLKQTPTSSKTNDDERYKHEVELVSERKILEDTYFYDAVVGDPLESDRPVTNSTKFFFYGNLEHFAQRMNASLQYTKLQKVNEDGVIDGYYVVIDPDISTNEKQLAFDDAVFFQALQESYNTFGIPFYFVGKEIHLGFTNNVIDEAIEYGADNALLSVTKSNANFKVVNRASGYGSTENIPYYYPNNSAKGEIGIEVNTTSSDFSVSIADYETFGDKVDLSKEISYLDCEASLISSPSHTFEVDIVRQQNYTFRSFLTVHCESEGNVILNLTPNILLTKYTWLYGDKVWDSNVEYGENEIHYTIVVNDIQVAHKKAESETESFSVKLPAGYSQIGVYMLWSNGEYTNLYKYNGTIQLDSVVEAEKEWIYNESPITLSEIGLSSYGTPNVGDTIVQTLSERIKVSETLQPSIYRATQGAERFYNAINYPFTPEDGYVLQYAEYIGSDGLVHNDLYKKDDGEYLVFVNPYVEGHPKEHVFSVEDIKPTIEEMTNNILAYIEEDDDGNVTNVYQRIDMFSEFAYDRDDNDETYIDDNGDVAYKHPYFFGKLRKLNFNLFECAIEDQPMTISMTSGHCGACTFEIGVSEEYPNQNPVQVDASGNLVYDEDGRVLCGLEDFQSPQNPQPQQQDTENYEVWIALKKEDSTYGILMPKAPKYEGETLIESGHRPKSCTSANANDGDTFVIIGIKLPDEYIEFAERKLEKKIIQYITENNNEKFNFSVNFSRIFLEENEDVLNNINENARFTLRYNGQDYLVYVSSFSYSLSEGDILPSITVELDNTLTIAQGVLQQAIDSVKSDMAKAINGIDVSAVGNRYFLRKDTDDVAEGIIGFKKGVIFGKGGDIMVNEDGSAKLTIDYLEVNKKATFTSLEIQEKSHVGGQFLITPASMVCSNIEEYDDYYRCYMETQGEKGEEIFNTFMMNDQAICQTFNAWGSKYYWRLVVGVGDNYIDLSKVEGEYDEESDAPSIGDKIIQLGNTSNVTRQAAQVLSSYGDSSPSFIMYNGINSFSLEGKEVTGIIWNPETQEPQMYSYGSMFFGDRELEKNYITFQQKEGGDEKELFINANITIGAGSSGLSNLSEWAGKQSEIDTANSNASSAKSTASSAVSTANTAKTTATNAQTTANTAKTTATNAQSTANTAKTTADEAKAAAENAQSTANSAQSTANAASATASTAKSTADSANALASQAKTTADNAATAASNAQTAADQANSQISDMSDDNKLTPQEKQQLAITWAGIQVEYQKNVDEASKFGVSTTKYKARYNDLNDSLPSLLSNLETTSEVSGTALRSWFSNYYTERTTLLNAISTKAKELADEAQSSADSAQSSADAAQKAADAAQEAADAANEYASEIEAVTDTLNAEISTVKGSLTESVIEINARLDGVVENFFKEGTPTTSNYPVSEWKAESETDDYELINHVGDTYTNIQEYVDDDTTPDAGKSWRWCWCDETSGIADIIQVVDKEGVTRYLHWHPIADSDAVKALLEASKAQATADGKARTFITTPTPPYKERDLWVQGNTGDIMRCKAGIDRAPGSSYVASDWEKASKYTDDTKADAVQAGIESWMVDGYFSPTEINSFSQTLLDVISLSTAIESDAAKYEVDVTYFSMASDAFEDYLNSIIESYNSAESKTDAIPVPSGFEESMQTYFEERQGAQDAIAEAQKNIIDGKAQASDLEVLTNNFKDGKTIIDGGLVMTSMVAVGDTANSTKVEAFLNGSLRYRDTTHGKLILAGGIPETSESGSSNLEDRAKEASTRIYEDGTTYTNKMVLDDGCSIGDNLKITAYTNTEGERVATIKAGTSYVESGFTEVAGYVGINSSGIHTEGTTLDGIAKSVEFGNFCNQSAQKIAIGKDNITACTMVDDGSIPVGLEIIAPDSYAIVATSGMFAGLRPKSRTINSSTSSSLRYLTKFDHTIFMNGNTTVYLPSSPLEGQEYVILTSTGGTISGNGKQIYLFADGNNHSSIGLSARTEFRLYWHKAEGKWWAQYTV